MSLIEDGLAMLNDFLDAEASIAIVYNTGTDSISLNAVPTKPPFVQNTTGPATDPAKAERNFSVLASELAVGAVEIRPETSHYITELTGTGTHRYNVSKPVSGVGCWEWDSGEQNGNPQARIIVHTKYAGTV